MKGLFKKALCKHPFGSIVFLKEEFEIVDSDFFKLRYKYVYFRCSKCGKDLKVMTAQEQLKN